MNEIISANFNIPRTILHVAQTVRMTYGLGPAVCLQPSRPAVGDTDWLYFLLLISPDGEFKSAGGPIEVPDFE